MAKKILIVDDEPHVIKLLESRLTANGYNIISAADGQEGLDKVHNEGPDLVLLDVMLPKINGYKLCRMLKFDEKYGHIPIVMFTSRARGSDQKLGIEVGADAYITKPFKPEVLLEKIRGLLKE